MGAFGSMNSRRREGSLPEQQISPTMTITAPATGEWTKCTWCKTSYRGDGACPTCYPVIRPAPGSEPA